MNQWNTICSDLVRDKIRQTTEKEYQKTVFTHFYYLLGWYVEKVEQQYQVRVGCTVNYVYPDIVFFTNNEPSFVVEMKKPDHIQVSGDIEQLHSYMILLNVHFGIYIGEYIELFYCDRIVCKEPISILKIELIPDSEKGKMFVELFKRDNFNINTLTAFCKSQLEKINKERQINEYVNDLSAGKGEIMLTELLTTKLYGEGFADDVVGKIIESIEVRIIRKNQVQSSEMKKNVSVDMPVVETSIGGNVKANGLDYTRYKLNGNGNYGKGRLALAITKQYVQDNPHLSYSEIKKRVPLAISAFSDIQSWKLNTSDKSKNTRWFEDEEDLMVSADGITFAFTTQIGSGNISRIIEFGRAQGYTIEVIL